MLLLTLFDAAEFFGLLLLLLYLAVYFTFPQIFYCCFVHVTLLLLLIDDFKTTIFKTARLIAMLSVDNTSLYYQRLSTAPAWSS